MKLSKRAFEGKRGNMKSRRSFFEERLDYKMEYLKRKLKQITDFEKSLEN